jgi:hypothetical protein
LVGCLRGAIRRRPDSIPDLCGPPGLSTAGVKDLHDQAKVERCARVAGEVVCIVTTALKEFFDGKWVAPAWNPAPEIQHCIKCHGPDSPAQQAPKWNQHGHMECLSFDDQPKKRPSRARIVCG